MQTLKLNARLAFISGLIACGVSALAWAFNFAWFLTLPGGILTNVLFGRVSSMTNRPLRLGLNVVGTSILIYLGAALWTWGKTHQQRPAPSGTQALFVFWCILLAPWMLFGPLSAMAFDGGYTAQAYVFFGSSITYPISVVLAAILRRWYPYAVLVMCVKFCKMVWAAGPV